MSTVPPSAPPATPRCAVPPPSDGLAAWVSAPMSRPLPYIPVFAVDDVSPAVMSYEEALLASGVRERLSTGVGSTLPSPVSRAFGLPTVPVRRARSGGVSQVTVYEPVSAREVG